MIALGGQKKGDRLHDTLQLVANMDITRGRGTRCRKRKKKEEEE